MNEHNGVRGWLGQFSLNIYHFFEVVAILLTFIAGTFTGAMTSYTTIRADASELKARVSVIEDQMHDVRAEVQTWRTEDREFAAEMRKSMASITALLMVPPARR